ncbi:MAG: biotin--[acetyl-CoA-carboxylase] ligase [Eudoraea sp.]|nr:biotin--[acetyl-CoA-carboxylase] ligase [Eudoraea sp.]
MVIIKLDAIGSTNEFLKDLAQKEQLSDYTLVCARHQKKGKGQRSKSWATDAGKNLTFSILKLHSSLQSTDQFRISIHAGLIIIDILKQHGIPDLALKWPNDIMSGGRKICGVLIENSIRGQDFIYSVIGIGLNVNQESFPGLPKAISMKQITGRHVNLDELLGQIQEAFKKEFEENGMQSWEELKERYEGNLYLKDGWVTFKENGNQINGRIEGITPTGQLNIELEGGNMRSLSQGELQWLL